MAQNSGGITSFLIALMVFVAMASGGLFFIAGMNEEYNANLQNVSAFNDSFGNIQYLADEQSEFQEITDPGSEGYDPDTVSQTGWSLAKAPAYFSMLFSMGYESTTYASKAQSMFGLPAWFAVAIGAIILLVAISLVISAIFRRDM